jgi:hypothetical protein
MVTWGNPSSLVTGDPLPCLAQPEEAKASLPFDGIKVVMVSGDQRHVEPFCQRHRKGIGKGKPLFDFQDSNPLDECIIGISTECEWKGESVGPCCLSCRDPALPEKVIVDLSEDVSLQGFPPRWVVVPAYYRG